MNCCEGLDAGKKISFDIKHDGFQMVRLTVESDVCSNTFYYQYCFPFTITHEGIYELVGIKLLLTMGNVCTKFDYPSLMGSLFFFSFSFFSSNKVLMDKQTKHRKNTTPLYNPPVMVEYDSSLICIISILFYPCKFVLDLPLFIGIIRTKPGICPTKCW